MTIKDAINKLNEILERGFSDNLVEGKIRNKAIKKAIQSLENKLDVPITEIYPYNLALKIIGFESDESKELAQTLSINGIKTGLKTLTDREQLVLEYRYKDIQTLEQVGKLLGVTRERVRQIEAKALRKLRHPTRLTKMKAYTYEDMIRGNEERNELREQNKLLEKAIKLYAKEEITKDQLEEMAKKVDVNNVSIDELDLSVRSYNCLKRRGIDTLGELLEITYAELSQVRNLGAKSREEVMRKLQGLNLTLKGSVDEKSLKEIE